MKRSVLLRAILFSLLLTTFFSNANAVPLVLSHQGRLLDAGDAPISGTFTITYSIYDAPVAGTQLWMEDHVGVVVTDGLFSVELGSTVPLTADIVAGSGGGGGGAGGAIRYLQVQLQGQPPISPRTPLVSSPYSVASSRVSGDIQTAPGQISVSDALSSREIRIRTTDSLLDASSITIDQPDAQISLRITPDSTIYDQGDASGSRKMIHGIHMGENRISQVVTPTTSSVAINTKGTGAEKSRVVMQTTLGGLIPGASAVLDADSDGDGIPEGEISQSVTPTTCGVAINTKGTGADKGRMAGSSCDDSSAVHYLDIDDDGDGHAEARGIISVKSPSGSGSGSASSRMSCDSDDDGVDDNDASMIVTPTTSSVAIKTKGTGADANKTASVTMMASPGGNVGTSCVVDLDGDNDPESEISQFLTPTTCGVAIKTKGTGADKNRTIGSSCDDSLMINYLDMDDDGDGISEASAVSAVSSLGGGGGGASAAAYARWYTDSDDDGVPEGDITQSVTPTTCGVAIKTKGTGADPNRVVSSQTGTTPFEVSGSMSIDDDGDTVPESEFSQSVTPTTCGVAIKVKGTGADKDRIIGGDCDDSSAVVHLDLDDDGDGHAEARGIIAVKSPTGSGAGSASNRMSYDSNDDGVADVTGEMVVDADSACFRLNGLPPGVPVTGTIQMTASPTGAHMSVGSATCDGTNWVNASDRNSKENFERVDGSEILEKISDLEITKWNYKGDDDAQHIGPTAQDFKKTFGVGADDKSISTIDPSGIALAAIKELYAQLQAKDKEMKELREEMAKLKKEMAKKN